MGGDEEENQEVSCLGELARRGEPVKVPEEGNDVVSSAASGAQEDEVPS